MVTFNSGIRQGGRLVFYLAPIYIDVLIKSLENVELTCWLTGACICCIVYADGVNWLPASVCMLQC